MESVFPPLEVTLYDFSYRYYNLAQPSEMSDIGNQLPQDEGAKQPLIVERVCVGTPATEQGPSTQPASTDRER